MDKKRSLNFSCIYAPSDFVGILASNYSGEDINRVARDIENNPNDSRSFKMNLEAIEKYRESL